ncbi:hypothetical protein A1O7_07976 [Cladophialophora yegresii CBS 114405]|uniref:Reticulon-like protein n=1 Tax=Cladophialophora yegresii CBS 114405 TaxID=1182544 RepID=W9VPG1_9EURO|nr:uncharacterized protein A1O7_07976 [Cladophialophora yegresii CBS 114405]EXJ57627.1 hypothetical protein A1O7_07976 [Cladophialophora yegresii CBS 114405]
MSTFAQDSDYASQGGLSPETKQASQTNGVEPTTLQQTLVNNASAAAQTIQQHPITQNLVNGPVAQSARSEAAATKSEFSNLAGSRSKPDYTASNASLPALQKIVFDVEGYCSFGAPRDRLTSAQDTELTHYHSFFYTLLSWKNKRATGITFASAIAFIFAVRYLPIIRYVIKITWMSLGVVTIAEASSKALMGSSVASSLRPRRYYKIPKETLEASLDDLENLINFFVIEIQRIVFAENIPVTAVAFLTAFITYYLIKIVPFWGMALISTSFIFLAPLIYLENKEFIDAQLEHAGHVIGQQTNQIKDLTAQHTSKGLESVKQYTGTAAAKAQDLVGTARQKIPSPTTGNTPVKENDFPSAPQTDLPDTNADVLQRETDPVPAS